MCPPQYEEMSLQWIGIWIGVCALRSPSCVGRSCLRWHADSGPDELDDAELIAGELLANAVDHSRGPIWVSLDWPDSKPTLTVRDMGAMFTLPVSAPAVAQPRGRGLWLVSQLAPELSLAARRVGKTVEAVLPVTRPVQHSVDPPRFVGGRGDVPGRVCGDVFVEPAPQFVAQRAGMHDRCASRGLKGARLTCGRHGLGTTCLAEGFSGRSG